MDVSPLARLPAELRNYIYELALTLPSPVTFTTEHRDATPCVRSLHTCSETSPKHILALTQTCKEVRADTDLLFFAVNTFLFAGQTRRYGRERPLFDTLRYFPSTIGPDAVKALRHVYIAFAPLDCDEQRYNTPCSGNITNQCSSCLKFCGRLAQVRQWLLRKSSLQVTVFLGWRWSPAFTVVDLKDLSKPWTMQSNDPQHLENMLKGCWTGWLIGRPSTNLPDRRSEESRKKHADKLESWRDGVGRFAQLAKSGVRPGIWATLSQEKSRQRLSCLQAPAAS